MFVNKILSLILLYFINLNKEREYDIIKGLKDRSVIVPNEELWKNGTVPYLFDNIRTKYKAIIINAMENISKHSCIQFIPLETTSASFLNITNNTMGACMSLPGQHLDHYTVMTLADECMSRPDTLIHELLHTLGFGHEQSRSDRDAYIRIIWENVQQRAYYNYYKCYNHTKYRFDCSKIKVTYLNAAKCTYTKEYTTLGLPYDFGSIMHYRNNSFAIDYSKVTMEAKVEAPFNKEMRLSKEMSFWDIVKLRSLYNCTMCLTVNEKKPCIFPFIIKGKSYSVCTSNSGRQKGFCATSVDPTTLEMMNKDECEPQCFENGKTNNVSISCDRKNLGETGTAEHGDFPWVAFIIEKDNINILCEAALITPKHVLTLMSCTQGHIATELKVKVGTTNYDYTKDILSQTSTVKSVMNISGLGLVKVVNGFYLNDRTIPVALSNSLAKTYDGRKAMFNGRSIPPIHPLENRLKYIVLQINKNYHFECGGKFKICTEKRTLSSNENPGAPLVICIKGKCTLVGIHSPRSSPSNYLLYIRVQHIFKLIEPNILYSYNLTDLSPL